MDHTDTIAAIAGAIRDHGVATPPTQTNADLGLGDAYAIQDGVIRTLETGGMRRIGAKIGLSAPQAQAAMGLSAPLSGLLFDTMHRTDGAVIPAGEYRAPRVEAEICFRMGADLTDPDMTEADVRAAIADIMPAIEVVDSRYADWSGKVMDMLAEDISVSCFVCGTPVENCDPATLGDTTMTLSVDGVQASDGVGSATHGGPLLALHWLARNLVERGWPLRAGDYVMSGAFAPMLPVAAGARVQVDMAGIGSVSVSFETS